MTVVVSVVFTKTVGVGNSVIGLCLAVTVTDDLLVGVIITVQALFGRKMLVCKAHSPLLLLLSAS